jgi:hypothetical protein
VPLLFVYGIGVGFATAQLTGVVLADVPVARSGQGSGTQSTARRIGSAFGIAILDTVLFATLESRLTTGLEDLPDHQRTALVEVVKDTAGAAIPALATDPRTVAVADEARAALTDATRVAALTAAGFLVVGLAASLSLAAGPPGPPSNRLPRRRRRNAELTERHGGNE